MSANNKYQSLYKTGLLFTSLVSLSTVTFARGGGEGPPPPDTLTNPLAITLIIIIAALALVNIMLAWILNGAAGVYLTRNREKKTNSNQLTALLVIGASFLSSSLYAQDAKTAAVAQPVSTGGLSTNVLLVLMAVIIIELISIFYMLYNLQVLVRKDKESLTEEEAVKVKPAARISEWWTKINRFKSNEEESTIDTGHDYDGIRELDNKLPPWWLYGFYACIVFAGIYLWRYHVSHSAPSSEQEYKIAMTKAEAEKEEYLKKAANKVDENTVVMLDAAGIAAGQAIYTTNCAACHGRQGEGGVGPNLTDDYWLHGGKINDVFKTIKYGVAEKGMRSWKDDFNPVQIAQIASYIKSIHGSNPPNGKEKQGELYKEENTTAAK